MQNGGLIKMNKCHYYLSNGLWKVVECYFDVQSKSEIEYVAGMAVQPNGNSFGSHIISTPWQQCWAALDLLQRAYGRSDEENKIVLLTDKDMNVVRKEVDFQYLLRNYHSDPYVEIIFTAYSKSSAQVVGNLSEADGKGQVKQLVALINTLQEDSNSEAHLLVLHLIQNNLYIGCLEQMLLDSKPASHMHNLLTHGFALGEPGKLSALLPQPLLNFESSFILLASNQIELLKQAVQHEKQLLQDNGRQLWVNLLESGLVPAELGSHMMLLGQHFLLQLLDVMKDNMSEFSSVPDSAKVPSCLWTLFLLKNWDKGLITADNLLSLLEKCKRVEHDKTILQMCFILEWYMNFSKWFKHHGSSQSQEPHMLSNNLLAKAKEHSVLYLINNSTDLSIMDWNQIKDLLAQRGSRSPVTEGGNCKPWDVVLFDGYCAIMTVLEAIVACNEIEKLARSQRTTLPSVGQLNELFSDLYENEVTKRIKTARQIIKSLYPLHFQLEILENIFSLVFVTFEDIKNFKFYGKQVVNPLVVEKLQLKIRGKIAKVDASPLVVDEEDQSTATAAKGAGKAKGFVCRKHMARDLIYFVKGYLEALEEVPSSHIDVSSQMGLSCSIKPSQTENRLDRLSECMSEATWRLQLVTEPGFVTQVGTARNLCQVNSQFDVDTEWMYVLREPAVPSKLRKKSAADKTTESGSQSHSSPGTVGDAAGAQQTPSSKSRSHAPQSVMGQMLACDSSLVVHCMAMGDVLNANHIIQMMSTEENRQTLEGELHFTESINNLKKKLQNISVESPSKRGSVDVARSWSLQSIQMVANQGLTSTAITNHVERFLSATTLPVIQGASKVSQGSLGNLGSLGSMLQCIENWYAMVTIDLALTTSITFQDFRDLLNIASKHCPELSTRAQSPITAQAFSKPMGYIAFSQNVITLLQEVNRRQAEETDAELSVHQFLRAHQYPFSIKSLKDNIGFWKQLKLAVADLKKCAADSGTGSRSQNQKSVKEMQKVLETVTKLTEGFSEVMELGRGDVNYCDLLCRYLSDLATLVMDNTDDAVEVVTFPSLLQQSAVDIVDRLVFTYQVEPSALEKKAQQLGFNLSASLVAGCCPSLPQGPPTYALSPASSPDDARPAASGVVVLNLPVTDHKVLDEVNPTRVVTSILSELLIAFRNYSRNKDGDNTARNPAGCFLTRSDLEDLRTDFKVQKILEKTVELEAVDLNLLVSGEETLAFFTNLLNLIQCHCHLTSKLGPADCVFSDVPLYRDVGEALVGYMVGTLGFLSVADIRAHVFGEEVRSMFTPRERVAWSTLKLHTDSRVAFAIATCRGCSPRLCLVPSSGLDAFLEAVTSSYIQVSALVESPRLVVTDTISWYLEEVLMKQEPESHSASASDGGRPDEKMRLLLDFLAENSSGDHQVSLNNVFPTDLTLDVAPSPPGFELTLEYPAQGDWFNRPRAVLGPEVRDRWSERTLNEPILKHLSQSSRVLAEIIQKTHEAREPAQMEVARDVLTEEKLKHVDLLLASPWAHQLAPLYGNNPVLAALSKYPPEEDMAGFLQDAVSCKQWDRCLDVLLALPDHYVSSCVSVRRTRDLILTEMTRAASLDGADTPWYYANHIGDVVLKAEAMMTNCKYWPGPVARDQLCGLLRDFPALPTDLRSKVQTMSRQVQVYHSIAETCSDLKDASWLDIFTLSNTTPQVIINNLVRAGQFELCLEWCDLPGVVSRVQQLLDTDLVLVLLSHTGLADKLLSSLDTRTLVPLCREAVSRLQSTSSILHVTHLLPDDPSMQVTAVGVELVQCLDVDDRSRCVHLVSQPLLIVEQLLMNTSLQALDKILYKIRKLPEKKMDLSEIHSLIARYASKAVELRFIKSARSPELKESFLLDSSSTTSTSHISQEFVVPAVVPDKSEWVPDSQVSLCMCCLLVTFSMFNRRHHCRRCGRVVCGACSPLRLKVSGYKGVPVRVCQACFAHHTQPEGDLQRVSMSLDGSSLSPDSHFWKLSISEVKNAAVREEFSYENAPDVSLCLALFNFLSDVSYTSLLLDEAERMLGVLQSNIHVGNTELDCAVLIQMIRSLILGAKVQYAQANLTTGVASCDRLLSQVDLLHLLVKNHCSRLIPSEPLTGPVLRQLRDRLVEEESWQLALEVSTKSGLDGSGVWAAWGKVCLSAGCWEEARTKFSHCLKPLQKPSRNPALVDEICRILETATSSMRAPSKVAEKKLVAEEVSQILSTLKLLSSGKSLPNSSSSVRYEEQVFYMTMYGSQAGLLSFYVNHEQWRTALEHVVREDLDPDLFLECIFLAGYRAEKQEVLKAEMLAVDPSLELFKKYLSHSCLYLEKQGHLYMLYDLQMMMQDFIRAAMTCVRLYQRGANNFTQLVTRAHHLHTALRHLEKEMAVLNEKTRRLDSALKLDSREVTRHMNTVWSQLEVAKFLAGCEQLEQPVLSVLLQLQLKEAADTSDIPTLFEGNNQRMLLAALVILSGKNVEEGFGVAFRIIQDYRLEPERVYLMVALKLAEQARVGDVDLLVGCIKTSGASDVVGTCDNVLSTSVAILASLPASRDLEPLIKKITNIDLKISALIDARQLKSAYLLAVKYNRITQVGRIKNVAEELGQEVIKTICMKKLGLGQSPEGSVCSSVPSQDIT